MHNLLVAAKANGVEKMVCTSDLITMIDLEKHKREHITKPYDENGSSNEALLDPFMRGKIRMETKIKQFI